MWPRCLIGNREEAGHGDRHYVARRVEDALGMKKGQVPPSLWPKTVRSSPQENGGTSETGAPTAIFFRGRGGGCSSGPSTRWLQGRTRTIKSLIYKHAPGCDLAWSAKRNAVINFKEFPRAFS